jgi:DNA gyrase subunit A
MYADEDMVISISHLGYIKRTPLSEYRAQHRGGKGSKGSITRDEDFIEYLFVATMHNYLLFFTEQGKVFWLRVYEVPEGGKTSKGRAIQNMINIPPEDKVKAFVNVKDLKDEEYTNNNYVVLCTKKGVIKKTTLALYSRPRANGIIAINIREGDQLLEAKLTSGEHDIMLGVRSGKAIRFPESKVRPMGRGAAGVKGITLSDPKKDEVIGMICVLGEDESILVVAEKGIGKRSSIEDYRITNRGGKGVKTINITQKTGALIALKSVTDENDLMIMNKSGIMIRLKVSTLRVMGRATQGVKLINLKEGDAIAAVTKVEIGDEEDNLMEGEEGEEGFEGENVEEASEAGTVVETAEVDEADETDEEKDQETDESADEGDEEGDEEGDDK